MIRTLPKERERSEACGPGAALGSLGKTVALACGLALACSWSSPGRAFTPAGEAHGVELEVEIDPRIDGADDLVTWVDEVGRKALTELPANRDRHGVVRVAIGGELYDYDVTMTPLRAGESVAKPSTWECECSNEELLERLRRQLPGVAEQLVVKRKLRIMAPKVPPEPVAVDDTKRARQRKKLGPVGGTGIAVTLVGLAGVGAGIALVERESKTHGRGDDIGGLTSQDDYSKLGISAIAGGAGLALTGLVMVLLGERSEARRNERAQVQPRIVAGARSGVMISGRF
jgi:hypothetical protein